MLTPSLEERPRAEAARNERPLELILYPAAVALLVASFSAPLLPPFGPRCSLEELKGQVLSWCDGPWGQDSPAPCEIAARGEDGVPALVDLLLSERVSPRGDVQGVLTYQLVRIGEATVPILLEAFETADGEAKARVVWVLQDIADELRGWGQRFDKPKFGRKPGERLPDYPAPLRGPIASKKALSMFEKGIQSTLDGVPASCVRILGNIGGPEAIGILVRHLRDPEPYVLMHGFAEMFKSEEYVCERCYNTGEWEAYVKRMEDWYQQEYLPAMEKSGFPRR